MKERLVRELIADIETMIKERDQEIFKCHAEIKELKEEKEYMRETIATLMSEFDAVKDELEHYEIMQVIRSGLQSE
jgi:uncharacterized coiled-coil DUF342 family protein